MGNGQRRIEDYGGVWDGNEGRDIGGRGRGKEAHICALIRGHPFMTSTRRGSGKKVNLNKSLEITY